jgi:hypothetical protein
MDEYITRHNLYKSQNFHNLLDLEFDKIYHRNNMNKNMNKY